ncbi:MAG: cache domain-containing protein [Syntrophales bacterium]
MKRFLAVLMVMGLMVASFGIGSAASQADEAKAMVEKAVAYVQANGKAKAIAEFNNPKGQFVKGELYVFAYDSTATIIAHPVNAKLVGVNTLETPDVDGKYWRKEAMEKVKKDGTAWVDYKFKNPQSGKIEQKTSYFKKVNDIILGCGAYK